MNVTRIISKVVKVLPKLEGTQARFTIGSKQLAQITKENKEAVRLVLSLILPDYNILFTPNSIVL